MFNSDDRPDDIRRAAEQLMSIADWTYEYSDDFGAWERGRRQMEEIDRLLGLLPYDMAKELIRKYEPKFICDAEASNAGDLDEVT